MIYETALVLRTDLSEEVAAKAKSLVTDTVKEFGGEILVDESWGVKSFAQPTSSGITHGNYHYFIFKVGGTANAEIERKFGISEDILKSICLKLGEDSKQEQIIKAYNNPAHKVVDADGETETAKDKKMFAKRKSCYFSAKKSSPDWKYPDTYSWLVNEFGKISPARITGLRPRYQRSATTAIKRGRNLGLISHISNRVAR